MRVDTEVMAASATKVANDLAALLLSIKKLTGDAHQGYADTVTANRTTWA